MGKKTESIQKAKDLLAQQAVEAAFEFEIRFHCDTCGLEYDRKMKVCPDCKCIPAGKVEEVKLYKLIA